MINARTTDERVVDSETLSSKDEAVLDEAIRMGRDWIARTDDFLIKRFLIGQLVSLEAEKIRLKRAVETNRGD